MQLLLYYTRAVPSRRLQYVCASLVAMVLGSAALPARQLPPELTRYLGPIDLAADYQVSSHHYDGTGASLDLSLIVKTDAAGRADALAATATQALALLDRWLGPLTASHLSIIDVPWQSELAGASFPGVLAVGSRWLAPSRDRARERELIAGLARQYWLAPAAGEPWFQEALVLYTAGRAIDTLLEGSQFHTDRHLGGFVPFAVRSLALSPQARDARPRLRRYRELEEPAQAAWRFAAAAPGGRAERGARALEVAERYLGWPAIQQALAALRATPRDGAVTLGHFVSLLCAQQGRDLAWLFAETTRVDAGFDYAVAAVENVPGAAGIEVRVTVERRGAVFAGTTATLPPGAARSLPVETRFADGSSIRDWWDGRQDRGTLAYVSATPAVWAAIDPDVMLVLDEDRSNNAVYLEPAPWNRLAVKLASDWAIWLQHAMLAYVSLV